LNDISIKSFATTHQQAVRPPAFSATSVLDERRELNRPPTLLTIAFFFSASYQFRVSYVGRAFDPD